MSPSPLADHGTCNDCGARMRSGRASADHFPGTEPRLREGQCVTCYRLATRAAEQPDLTAEQERRDRFNTQALQAWIQWRRNRGVPEQGWNAA